MNRLLLCFLLCLPVVAQGAIAVTYKGSLYSTSNTQSTYTSSPAWTPVANSLLVALVVTTYGSGTPTDPSDVSGHGITYTKLTLGTSTYTTSALENGPSSGGVTAEEIATAVWVESIESKPASEWLHRAGAKP